MSKTRPVQYMYLSDMAFKKTKKEVKNQEPLFFNQAYHRGDPFGFKQLWEALLYWGAAHKCKDLGQCEQGIRALKNQLFNQDYSVDSTGSYYFQKIKTFLLLKDIVVALNKSDTLLATREKIYRELCTKLPALSATHLTCPLEAHLQTVRGALLKHKSVYDWLSDLRKSIVQEYALHYCNNKILKFEHQIIQATADTIEIRKNIEVTTKDIKDMTDGIEQEKKSKKLLKLEEKQSALTTQLQKNRASKESIQEAKIAFLKHAVHIPDFFIRHANRLAGWNISATRFIQAQEKFADADEDDFINYLQSNYNPTVIYQWLHGRMMGTLSTVFKKYKMFSLNFSENEKLNLINQETLPAYDLLVKNVMRAFKGYDIQPEHVFQFTKEKTHFWMAPVKGIVNRLFEQLTLPGISIPIRVKSQENICVPLAPWQWVNKKIDNSPLKEAKFWGEHIIANWEALPNKQSVHILFRILQVTAEEQMSKLLNYVPFAVMTFPEVEQELDKVAEPKQNSIKKAIKYKLESADVDGNTCLHRLVTHVKQNKLTAGMVDAILNRMVTLFSVDIKKIIDYKNKKNQSPLALAITSINKSCLDSIVMDLLERGATLDHATVINMMFHSRIPALLSDDFIPRMHQSIESKADDGSSFLDRFVEYVHEGNVLSQRNLFRMLKFIPLNQISQLLQHVPVETVMLLPSVEEELNLAQQLSDLKQGDSIKNAIKDKLESQDAEGNTCLHRFLLLPEASIQDEGEILITMDNVFGVDIPKIINYKNKDGKSALELAVRDAHRETSALRFLEFVDPYLYSDEADLLKVNAELDHHVAIHMILHTEIPQLLDENCLETSVIRKNMQLLDGGGYPFIHRFIEYVAEYKKNASKQEFENTYHTYWKDTKLEEKRQWYSGIHVPAFGHTFFLSRSDLAKSTGSTWCIIEVDSPYEIQVRKFAEVLKKTIKLFDLDPNIKDKHGDTPSTFAKKRNYDQEIIFLSEGKETSIEKKWYEEVKLSERVKPLQDTVLPRESNSVFGSSSLFSHPNTAPVQADLKQADEAETECMLLFD